MEATLTIFPRLNEAQQTDLPIAENSLQKIEQAIAQKSWEQAHKELYSLFLNIKPTTPLEQVQRLCLCWRQLMPFLEAKQISALKERGFEEVLVHFPSLAEEQLDLALAFAEWHLNHDSPQLEKAFFNAMHYYAQALKIAERHQRHRQHEIHCLATRLLAQLLFTQQFYASIHDELDMAYRKGDANAFENILNRMENLAHFCTNAEEK